MYVLKNKYEVFGQFQEWKAQVKKFTGCTLKTLRSDNGGEFTSNEFSSFLKTEGVRHEFTVPKCSEQNGVAERMNHILVEMIRAMLCDATLPQQFWAETLSTAVYLRNQSPTKSLSGMTPIEALTGEKPNFQHLRIFGFVAYSHVPKDEWHKLDSKARKCWLWK